MEAEELRGQLNAERRRLQRQQVVFRCPPVSWSTSQHACRSVVYAPPLPAFRSWHTWRLARARECACMRVCVRGYPRSVCACARDWYVWLYVQELLKMSDAEKRELLELARACVCEHSTSW